MTDSDCFFKTPSLYTINVALVDGELWFDYAGCGCCRGADKAITSDPVGRVTAYITELETQLTEARRIKQVLEGLG